MVFSEIYSRGCRAYNTPIVHGAIPVSRRDLQKALGLGRTRIEGATKELIESNILSISDNSNKKRFYTINWKEITYANSVLSKLSCDGIEAIRGVYRNNGVICPISKIDAAQIKKISEAYQFEWDKPGMMLNDDDVEINPVSNKKCSESTQSNEKCAEINPVDIVKCSESTQSDEKVHEINPVNDEKCTKSAQSIPSSAQNQPSHTQNMFEINPVDNTAWVEKQHQIIENEDGELILNVFLDDLEQIIAKRIGFSEIRFVASTGLISSSTGLISSSTGLISSSTGLISSSTGLISSSTGLYISPVNNKKCTKSTQSDEKVSEINPVNADWAVYQPTVNIYKEEKERKNNKKQEKEEKVNTGIKVEKVENILTTVETERSEVSDKVKVVRGCSNRGMGEEEPGEEENPEMQTFQLGEIEETPDGPLEIIELRDIPADELYEEIKEAARKKTKTVKDNPYRNKPYFSEEAAKRLTSVEGLEEEGYKSPVKLFLFNFWGGLYDEYYLECIEPNLPVDEYGNQMQGELQNDLDMLGHLIPVEDMARLVAQAWGETADQIECGFVELEDRKVNLEIEEVPDIRFGCLVDWKLAENVNKQPAFIISLKGFRNIEGTDAVEVKVPRTKEEKKAFNRTNRHFLACVTQMEDSQLTPMEQAAKSFAKHYLRMDEYFNVYGFMNGQGLEAHTNNILPGWMMQTWLPTLGELGVDREEFYKILNVPGGYKHGADYQKLNSIFVYDEVRRWNEMKGFQSQINQEKLDTAILSDF